MKKKIVIAMLMSVVGMSHAIADPVEMTVTMNSTTRTMQLVPFSGKDAVEAGDPVSNKYTFQATPGRYLLSGFTSAGLRNGTLVVDLTEESPALSVFTVTAKATNKDWVLGEDYTVVTGLVGKNMEKREYIGGVDKDPQTAVTFLALSGDTYTVSLVPNDAHKAEGYLTYTESNPITFNKTISKAIPMGHTMTLTAPKGAKVFIGSKIRHFVPFEEIEAVSVEENGDNVVYTYFLAEKTDFNYRVSMEGKVTTAAKFTMPAEDYAIVVTEEDMAGDPKFIDRDLESNNKYNVADIFLNGNHTGSINLKSGNTYQIVNLRNWEIVDGVTSNYFIEPDFHYAVYDDAGKLSNDVVEVGEDGVIYAKAKGTAIVLVTYDALNAPSQAGGPLFGAIWPENTGVIVVNVDVDTEAINVVPNTTINADLNTTNADKLAGANIDAELDVIYFTGENAKYTFTPENATNVRVANSSVVDDVMKFGRFLPSNAQKNDDGSYTVKLTEGKNIIRVGNSNGNLYQVVRAKKMTYDVVNVSREGMDPAPGDEVKVVINGVYHPCNKLAGVYNMSAKIQYNLGESTVSSKQNQYQFAQNEAAHTITIKIPEDWDASEPMVITNGVLVASGYGDPYGGHRDINYEVGKNPNFTAVQHTAYFGTLPDITVYMPKGEPAAVATFENLELEPESVWAGDEEGDDWYYGLGYTQSFKSGGYSFVNYCIPDYDTWIGYAYTNKTSTTYNGLSDQFNSCVGHGYDNSDNYVVAYPDGTMWGESLEIKVDGAPQVVPGFYITNTAWVVNAILNGDNMTEGTFKVGDYFKIKIHALDADGNETATRDFCLADYRFRDEADRYYVKDWQYVDLSQLGTAAAFKFTFEGSRSNAYGLTTPTYFCIDNFGDTGVENVREEGEYFEDPTSVEMMVSEGEDIIYTAQGLRVSKISAPGIYIVNGEKRLVR